MTDICSNRSILFDLQPFWIVSKQDFYMIETLFAIIQILNNVKFTLMEKISKKIILLF